MGCNSNTALFDNYNTHFDFRRIEYLTVDDGNNNEMLRYVSSTRNGLSADDGTAEILLGIMRLL